jgi:hypothetical protein
MADKMHPTWEKELSSRSKSSKSDWVAVPRHQGSKAAHEARKKAKSPAR